jgi:hypothetical protein
MSILHSFCFVYREILYKTKLVLLKTLLWNLGHKNFKSDSEKK